MCYNMKRFEKMAEEKERLQKEQELSITVENQPKIPLNLHTKQTRQKKTNVDLK